MVIKVDMLVDSYRKLDGKVVQVTGYVGDYEVILYYRADDPELARIMSSPQVKERNKQCLGDP